MAKKEIKMKVVLTKAGDTWDVERTYRLLDYVTLTDGRIYVSKHEGNKGHELTDAAWWDKTVDLKGYLDAMTAATVAANAAAEGAGKVDATLGDDHVLTVTDRTGAVKRTALGDAADMARMKQSLGPYSAREDIVLTASATGYVISKDGVKTAKSGWAMAEFTAELGNEYLFNPGETDGEVCVFAEYIDKVEQRGIDYAYTYDEQGRVATAKATYDGATHSYTYAYSAGDGVQGAENCTITDDQTGKTVDYLPSTYKTKVGSYQPLTLLNAGAELPEDGYCRFVSNFQARASIKVVVSYKVAAADLVMKVVRDGMTASMCTQLSRINQKVDEAKAAEEELRKKVSLMGDAFVGFARISGDMDPKPADDYIYGNRKLVREIGKHMKIGTVKRVGNEAVLQHECAPGRITLASNGDAVKVDGTEGDLLVYIDMPLHVIRANEVLDGMEMSCMGVGLSPCVWQGAPSKKFEPFAMSPFYTVNAQLAGDERVCAHCVISDDVRGSGSAASGTVKNALNETGKGYPKWGISGLSAIHMAQNKNADPNTNYPYMGCYYEFYELWVTMMYAEVGTLNATDLYLFGVGCTHTSIANAQTWVNAKIAGDSGVKTFKADGTALGYNGIMEKSWKKGADGTADYNLKAMFGGTFYSMTKCGELQSVLDGISKAGLQDKVGKMTSIFSIGSDGNMVCSEDGSIDVETGAGMVVNKRYYVVRDVPGCEGLKDGVMTAMANCYVKMEFADGTYYDTVDVTGGWVIGKFSHSCYRGLSMPMDGMFRQMSGVHYTSSKVDGKYVDYFYYAEKWQDMAPLTDDVCYGDVGTVFNVLKGLRNKVRVKGSSGYVKKIDYSRNMFCCEDFGGSIHTGECCYSWNDHYMWGAVSGDLAEEGKEGVKALVAGCYADGGLASARSAHCYSAVSYGNSRYAGALAVPQLKLK